MRFKKINATEKSSIFHKFLEFYYVKNYTNYTNFL